MWVTERWGKEKGFDLVTLEFFTDVPSDLIGMLKKKKGFKVIHFFIARWWLAHMAVGQLQEVSYFRVTCLIWCMLWFKNDSANTRGEKNLWNKARNLPVHINHNSYFAIATTILKGWTPSMKYSREVQMSWRRYFLLNILLMSDGRLQKPV